MQEQNDKNPMLMIKELKLVPHTKNKNVHHTKLKRYLRQNTLRKNDP